MSGLCEEEVHLLILKHSPEGHASPLAHTWGPGGGGALSRDGDWQSLSVSSPFALLQPLGTMFCL